MRKILIAITLALAFTSSAAFAASWTSSDIKLSATLGSGSNASYLVVDFNSASYAFEYLWDSSEAGSITGEDLILALSDSTTGIPGLSIASHTVDSYGLMVDGISYDGHSGLSNYPDPWWNYWVGSVGNSQESSYWGCSSIYLSDGSIDSWVFSTDWTQAPAIPGVPEPSSLLALCSLIGLAGSARLLRGRRK